MARDTRLRLFGDLQFRLLPLCIGGLAARGKGQGQDSHSDERQKRHPHLTLTLHHTHSPFMVTSRTRAEIRTLVTVRMKFFRYPDAGRRLFMAARRPERLHGGSFGGCAGEYQEIHQFNSTQIKNSAFVKYTANFDGGIGLAGIRGEDSERTAQEGPAGMKKGQALWPGLPVHPSVSTRSS